MLNVGTLKFPFNFTWNTSIMGSDLIAILFIFIHPIFSSLDVVATCRNSIRKQINCESSLSLFTKFAHRLNTTASVFCSRMTEPEENIHWTKSLVVDQHVTTRTESDSQPFIIDSGRMFTRLIFRPNSFPLWQSTLSLFTKFAHKLNTPASVVKWLSRVRRCRHPRQMICST